MTADKETGSIEPLLLRYPDAARLLSMSEKAVQKLVADGELKVIRPALFSKTSSANRTVLIPVSEIRDWIERQLAAQEPGERDPAASSPRPLKANPNPISSPQRRGDHA